MTNAELALIYEIIDRDIKNGNTEDLKKVKNYILAKSGNLTNRNVDNAILNVGLEEFFVQCLPKEVRSSFNYHAMIYSIANAKKKNRDDVTVGDIVGIGKRRLLKYRNVGPKAVDVIEELLNKHGLSLNVIDTTIDEKVVK